MSRKKTIRIIITVLMTVMISIIGYKYFVLGYTFESIVPQPNYSVNLAMSFSGNGDDLAVRTFLPVNEQNQVISNEFIGGEGLDFRREITSLYNRGDWTQYQAKGAFTINYSFTAMIRAMKFNISPELKVPDRYEESMDYFLKSTDVIQVNDPLIVNLAEELKADNIYTVDIVRSLFDYVYDLGSRPFKGTTDAVTAAKLQEASCNGKSRLFSAMARQLNIPSRLVGGIILNTGTKRTSHQWIELYIAGYWIPFDTLNGHFAELPGNYLALYRGDESLFRHSRNIGFDYRYDIRKKTLSN
ncbi:MAG: transglutaminase family protein, partial [Spirochaetales bacterium]|nr:transglutaminase family protein [Spirochaetales bacterium]